MGEDESRNVNLIDWAAFWRRHEGWDEVEEWRDAQRRRAGLPVPYVPRASEVSAELMIEQLRRERLVDEWCSNEARCLAGLLDSMN